MELLKTIALSVAIIGTVGVLPALVLAIIQMVNEIFGVSFMKPKSKYNPRIDVWVAIRKEVENNFSHWGDRDWPIDAWVNILVGSVGEAAKETVYERGARLEDREVSRIAHLKNCRNELIATAALAIQAVESLDRNELKEYRQ